MTDEQKTPRWQSLPTGVIGAGTLGSRIALMLATQGGEVRLYDPSAAQVATALAYIERELPRLVAAREGAIAGRVVAVSSLAEAAAGAWMVVEAVPERIDLKKTIFAELDRVSSPDTILASNSSSFPTSQFIDGVSRPERVVNTHYYLPPEQRVVEVMSSGHSSEVVIASLLERLPAYGLVPFRVATESVGFIFNRIWAAIKRESLAVLADGASTPADVDRIFMLLTGSTTGPFRLMDKVGLDVVLDIEEHYAQLRPGTPEAPRQLLRDYIQRGLLGVKNGHGFYSDYT